MTPGLRDPAFLDSCRFEGDPPADDLVEVLVEQGSIDSARGLIADIVQGGAAPEGLIRDAWQAFVASEQLRPVDLALLLRAERVFRVWGAQIAMSLCFGSLAGGYAANRISHLLLGVSRLESQAHRRVFETTQLLFDVLGTGGMEPGGRGIETAQRVRLMHAGVRRLVREYQAVQPGEDLTSPTGDLVWQRSWGVPINQEDMIGTIMTMSVHVLQCLQVFGARISPEDRWAYVYTWLRVARVMGVKESLIPTSLAEAEELWALTQKRQFSASLAGAELGQALLAAIGTLIPGRGLRFIPRALVWKLNGPEVAMMVGLAPLRLHERRAFGIWLGFERVISSLESRNRFVRNKGARRPVRVGTSTPTPTRDPCGPPRPGLRSAGHRSAVGQRQDPHRAPLHGGDWLHAMTPGQSVLVLVPRRITSSTGSLRCASIQSASAYRRTSSTRGSRRVLMPYAAGPGSGRL